MCADFGTHLFFYIATPLIMKKIAGILLLSLFTFYACKKDKKVEENKFDRGQMLKNYAENLILPSYKDAQLSVDSLIIQIDVFNANTSISNLEMLQNAWIRAFSVWQYAKIYNVGPAAEAGFNKSLDEEVSTFPVSSQKIDDIISSNQFNLNDFNRDSRGFLAIEYLLFAGVNIDNNSVLTLFQNQSFRKTYLKECALHIKSKIDNVVNKWESGYLAEFTQNQGTDVGSSTSQLYNEFVKSFETNKNFKIELPMGLRPGQTQSEPQLVEAFYSGLSIPFIKIHVQAIENTYYGKSKDGRKGLGFIDYLKSVTGGPNLVESTLSQWANVLSTLNAIPDSPPLSELINSNPQIVDDFRLELQKHTRFFKSDMSSLLGIAITFSSGDGD